jgi:hypothetical protein
MAVQRQPAGEPQQLVLSAWHDLEQRMPAQIGRSQLRHPEVGRGDLLAGHGLV